MAISGIDNKHKEMIPIDPEKYPEGTFSHRQDNNSCTYFKGRCPVNLRQKDPEEDTCVTFCIPSRNDKTARRK